MKMLQLSLFAAVILSSVGNGGLAQSETVQPDGCEANDLPCYGRDSSLEESSWLQGQNQLPPKFPNIGYLGSSYNILKGNPHSTHGLDPGFMGQALYEFTYDQGRTTPDGRYTIPDHTNVMASSVCNFDFSSHSAHSVASYFQSLKVAVDASFGGWGASFSASADYNTVKNNTDSSESRYVKSQAKCEAYLAALQPGAKLSDGFKTAVKGLSNSDMNEYLDFVQEYGTHYLGSVTMGGRYGFQSEFETNKYMSMLSTGLDVSASAGYSGFVDVNAKASTEMQKKMGSEFNSYRESYSIYQVGGKPSPDPNGTAMAWAQTVKNDPMPVHYRLVEIADLFTKDNFDNDPDIEKKQHTLRTAIYYYCTHDLSLSFCDSTGPDSNARIRIVPSNDVKTLEGSVIFYQEVNTPYFAVMGMFIQNSFNPSNVSYALVDTRYSVPSLITTASNWIVVGKYGLRPNCSQNFTRVSDFKGLGICDETADCLRFLPKILPCVANHCLTQCSAKEVFQTPVPSTVYIINNGFKVFGNGNEEGDLNFFTVGDAGSYKIPDESLFMCLSSECVEDF